MSGTVTIVEGDLVNATGLVGHQCNCFTNHSKGLSSAIFAKWPEANDYQVGRPTRVPGTVRYHNFGTTTIVNMFGQYWQGPAGKKLPKSPVTETNELRIEWLRACLAQIVADGHKTLNLPHNMGGGLAGGNWGQIEKVLQDVVASTGLSIVLYQLPGAAAAH